MTVSDVQVVLLVTFQKNSDLKNFNQVWRHQMRLDFLSKMSPSSISPMSQIGGLSAKILKFRPVKILQTLHVSPICYVKSDRG